MTCGLVLLLLTTVPDSVFTNETPWASEEEGAITVESRPIEGSGLKEYRVTAHTSASVEQLCDAVFEWGTLGTDVPGLKQTKLLKPGADERVVYNQIERPLISNRDYAMTVKRQREAERCRIRFRATNDAAPIRPNGFVRIEQLWGSWEFTRDGAQSRIVYTLYADPAGSIPTFLVTSGQKSSAKESVTIALDKVKTTSAPDAGAGAAR